MFPTSRNGGPTHEAGSQDRDGGRIDRSAHARRRPAFQGELMIGWRSKQGVRTQAQPLSTRAPLHRRDEWPPELDEDASLRIGVAKLDPAARRQLREVLTWPESRRGDPPCRPPRRAGTPAPPP